MKMNLVTKRKHINSLISEQNLAEQSVEKETENLSTTQKHLVHAESAQVIAQHVAQTVQQQAHTRISKVVSRCLETVFDGDETYGFKIRFERKRGRTEAVLVLTEDGNEIDDIFDGQSGGIVDVASFALRLACIILAKPKLRKIVFLDEPFKFVSERYLDNVRLMLNGLAEDFGFQFVMVTHIKALETGKVIEL